MEYNVTQFNENTWIIEEGFVRFFLLTGSKEALLIDSGMQVGKAKETAESITGLPLKIINSHGDRDHIGGNFQFNEIYMHAAEKEYYLAGGGKGNVIAVADGDEIDLGDRALEIIHIPGHTPGSIAILDKKAKLLFGGDTVQQNSEIFMFGPGRDLPAYIGSLEKLLKMKDEFDTVLACHGDLPLGSDVVEKLLAGAKKVLAGEAKFEEKTTPFGAKVKACDAGCAVLLT